MRWVVGVWSVVALAVFGACSDSAGREQPPASLSPGPPLPCVPDRECDCGVAPRGLTRCDGDEWSCECTRCPPVEVPTTPVVTSCGGDLDGTWTLSQMLLASSIILTVNRTSVGSCPSTITPKSQLPRVVMTLDSIAPSEGNVAYLAQAAPALQTWGESCVTSIGAAFACGSSAWENVTNCQLDCDSCTCEISFTAYEGDGKWRSDGDTIVLAPWGEPKSFAYCVTDDRMALSSSGAYLEFERTPREPERACLGEPVPCSSLDFPTCSVVAGCVAYENPRCSGPTVPCDDQFTCPPEYCTIDQSLNCIGDVPCTAFKTEDECTNLGQGSACSWGTSWCEGTAATCSSNSEEACKKVPGCEWAVP